MSEPTELQQTIEAQIEDFDPAIDLVAVEHPATDVLRLYIDHPDGVDLGLCERVTGALRDLLESYSLEVSSPGADRPLTKPEHFRRFLGQRVKVKTEEAIEGRRNFTGTLTGADDDSVEVEVEADGAVRIPFGAIRRSNLIPNLDFGS